MRHSALATLSCKPSGTFPFILTLFTTIFVLLASQAATAQEAARQARTVEDASAASGSSTGTITGRVVGEDGRPLGDIHVFLHGAFVSVSPRAVVTDGAGRFQFKELPSGLYNVRVSVPSFIELPDENRSPLEPKYVRPGETTQVTVVKGGVITGSVLTAQGEPLVGANVRAVRVRDSQGRRIFTESTVFSGMPRMTDDRGIYRLYGLQPGTYIVVVGSGSPFYFGATSLYEGDVPTYYPSATRDTAAEVSLRAGEEVAGIDIRYRSERGHTVSGSVTGTVNSTGRFAMGVTLMRAGTGLYESQTYVSDISGKRVFSLNGIPDGEYEIFTQGYLEKGEVVASTPRRLSVRGADVTGLQLQLTPLASVAGRVVLEPLPKEDPCAKAGAQAPVQQTLVTVRREDMDKERQQMAPFSSGSGVPDEQGEFSIRNLSGGLFRLGVRPPGDDWYVRALSFPAGARAATDQSKPAGTRATAAPAPGTFSARAGERTTGITINLAQGAAALSGRVTSRAEGTALPANLRIYLVPAERERAEDLLRYSETALGADGSFNFTNLAPGRYWITLRPQPRAETLQAARMFSWDEEGRKTLRREAETAANAVELKPCQQVKDYALGYAAK